MGNPQFSIQLADNVPGIGAAGDRVTLALTPSEVREPTEIPEYLAGYTPPTYRGDELSPVVLVDKEEDKYRSFDSDDAFKRVQVKGSTQGAVPEVDPKSSLSSYKVVERYVGSFVPRQTQLQGTNNNNWNPVMAASRRCKRAIMLDREVDVFAMLGTAGNWAAGNQAAASGTGWGDLIAGDPIFDIQTLTEKSSQPISAIWMNQKIANRFLRHTSVREHMRQLLGDAGAMGIANSVASMAGNASITTDFVIPGLPMIRVAGAKVKDESTGLLKYVLPDVAVGVTVPPGGIPSDGEEIATTYTFRRKGISGTGLDIREFEVDNRGPLGGTMIVIVAADIPVMTANNAGGIITGV